MPVAAIILAAGESRRLGQPKQLLAYRGQTLIERAIRLANEAGASPVLVVLGANFAMISTAIQFSNAIQVHNDRWQQGIASSIEAGMRALSVPAPDADGVLLMGCDQPRLTTGHLSSLISEFEGQKAAAITASLYGGVRGVPAVFPRATFAELSALRGDRGARPVIESALCPVVALEFPGGEVDIDSPEDLALLE
jgi:CTP:molybdopterin cytidylyltransferase MocA